MRKGCAICWKDQQKIYDMFGDPEEYKQLQAEKAEKKRLEKERLEKIEREKRQKRS